MAFHGMRVNAPRRRRGRAAMQGPDRDGKVHEDLDLVRRAGVRWQVAGEGVTPQPMDGRSWTSRRLSASGSADRPPKSAQALGVSCPN